MINVRTGNAGDGLTVEPGTDLTTPSESLYTGPDVCMWKEPVKGWEYVTPTRERDFGGVLALTAEKTPKVFIKLELDPITGAEIVKLPSREDFVRESRMEILPSVQTPTSSGLTSQHNRMDFWSVRVNDKTSKMGLEAVEPVNLLERLSELTNNGALVDPALPAALTWYALNNPEKFGNFKGASVALSEPAVTAGLAIATKDRSSDPISHGSPYILIRRLSSESASQMEYATRPANVLGAVIAPALVEDQSGSKFLVIAKQYRPPVGAEIYAHTAGLIGDKLNADTTLDVNSAMKQVQATLQAELSEEVGAVSLQAADPVQISFIGVSAPGLSNELHFFTPVRVRIEGTGGGAADEGEKIDRVLLPLDRKSILNFVRANTKAAESGAAPLVRVETSFLAGLFCFLPELLEQK